MTRRKYLRKSGTEYVKAIDELAKRYSRALNPIVGKGELNKKLTDELTHILTDHKISPLEKKALTEFGRIIKSIPF